ncbi:MAG: hypothetical protein IJN53_02110 [Oscillospiraceae bacterium]|nr:hypothetical protein [Oscillospiraceae bacterium]
MAKKLMINCANCDARNILEENYSHYEQITINCAMVLTSPNAKAVMNKLPLVLNCANVLEIEGNVDLRTVNGSSEIKQSDAVPGSKYYMMVNGSLTIGPNTQAQLAQCVGMSINGSLTCPESIYASLSGVTVNGSTISYPDGAILLKRSAVIDKLFALRAKSSLYWSSRRMIMVDPQLDAEKLRSKGVTFSTKEVIISQSKVEPLIDLIDENAEIIIVPDGTAVVLDDITLNEDALRRYGKQLYVIGDVTVGEDADALDEIKYLNIRGDVKVPQAHKEKLLRVLTEISGEVEIAKPKGAVLEDKPYLKITKWMLEQQPLGLYVSDCAVVKIADDIPKELISQRLHIEDCAMVKCSEELEDAVTMVCTDVAKIGGSEEGDGMGIGDILKSAMGGIKGALETKVINAADYVL